MTATEMLDVVSLTVKAQSDEIDRLQSINIAQRTANQTLAEVNALLRSSISELVCDQDEEMEEAIDEMMLDYDEMRAEKDAEIGSLMDTVSFYNQMFSMLGLPKIISKCA